jgi:hypothetical protein
MAEIILFYIILPSIFLGIIFLGIFIKKNERYDIMFGIDWESILPRNRKRLLNIITSLLISLCVFNIIYFCTFYFFNLEIMIILYVTITMVIGLSVAGLIIYYTRW